jgi:tetratricopeptide (TPR) repeat protein
MDQTESDEGFALRPDKGINKDFIIHQINAMISTTEIDLPSKIRLISLYVSLKRDIFEQTGNLRDIEDAIEKQRVLIDLTSPEDDSFSEELETLSVLLTLQYERVGREQDLEEAIDKAQQAVQLTPPDQVGGMLSTLGNTLECRYRRTGKMADLDLAIEKAKEAVRLTLPNDPGLAGRLNNLGNRLTRRYERTGQTSI